MIKPAESVGGPKNILSGVEAVSIIQNNIHSPKPLKSVILL